MDVRPLSLPALLVMTFAGCAQPPDTNACQSIVDVGTMDRPVGTLVANGAVWRTSDPADPTAARVQYHAYTTYRVWHGLGHVPSLVPRVFAAFSTPGILSQQVGNVAELVPSCNGLAGVTDHYVLLRNAGGQDFQAIFEIE